MDILFKPNIHQIRSIAAEIRDGFQIFDSSVEPPGMTKLHECVDLSRKVIAGKMSYEKAKEKLEDPEYDGFQWKPFSSQQMEIIDATLDPEAPRTIMTEGAVRSGKTIGCTAAWLLFLEQSDFPEHLLSGKTKDTIYWNIVRDLESILGEGYYYYNYQKGMMRFLGKAIRIVGAYDDGSENRIRGMTAGSWYADEVTTYPDNFLKMGMTRPSVEGNKILWTTNPDSPYHIVHTDYMTNPKMLENNVIKVIHFNLEDNRTLNQRYIDDLKNSYNGVFYDRFILGLWTIAEGAIYNMFDVDEHTFPTNNVPFQLYDDYTVAVDYATSSVCAYTLMGIKRRGGHGGRIKAGLYDFHFLDEWYYDAAATKQSLTDGDYSKKMSEFIKPYPGVSRIFLPHDAGSLRTQLIKDGFVTVPLMPDVVNELKQIGTLIQNGQVKVSKKCDNIIKQFLTYVWDARAQQNGIDAPLKVNDHAMDSLRYNIIGYLSARRIPNVFAAKTGSTRR